MNLQNVIRLFTLSRSTKLLLFVLFEDLLFQLGEITSKKYKSPYLHLEDRLACAFWRSLMKLSHDVNGLNLA